MSKKLDAAGPEQGLSGCVCADLTVSLRLCESFDVLTQAEIHSFASLAFVLSYDFIIVVLVVGPSTKAESRGPNSVLAHEEQLTRPCA